MLNLKGQISRWYFLVSNLTVCVSDFQYFYAKEVLFRIWKVSKHVWATENMVISKQSIMKPRSIKSR